jgi:drug/metabolite transporter (DMT)-like permease
MDLHVFLAVLGAALCHAAWNAGLKLKVDPRVAVTILAVSGGLVSVPLLAVTGWPASPAWPYLAASAVIHVVYFTGLGEAYRTGDLGQVYPIARGTAPLLTATGSVLILGEPIGPLGIAGIIVLAAGILLLSLPRAGPLPAVQRRAIAFALLTAATIATYTLVDGRGARAGGDAHAYTVAFFLLNGLAMGAIGLLRHKHELQSALIANWPTALGGGVLSFVSYWVALWAMTLAPIALVAAVRETSVLFAAAIGVLVLGEPVVGSRIAAALLVVAGLVLIRLS